MKAKSSSIWTDVTPWMLLTVLALVSLFVNVWVPPLFLEEPRRALVPLEMYLSGEYIIQTTYGQPYCHKGPLYHWLQLSMSFLFGGFSHMAMRMCSIVSHLAIGLVIWRLGRRYLGKSVAWIAFFGYLLSVDIYYYFSLLGEMDLFYSLLSFLLFVSPYYFWERGQRWGQYVVPWVLAGLGILVKGAPSVVFVGLTQIAFYAFFLRNWRGLLDWRQFVGAIIGCSIVGSYVWAYSLSGSLDCWMDLWTQSSERTLIDTEIDFWRWSNFSFLVEFPLEFLKNTLPLSPLLLVLWVRRDVTKRLWQVSFLRYLALVFLLNIVVYWISPGTRSRYVYMFFPLLAIWMAAIWEDSRLSLWAIFYRSMGFVGGLLFLAGVAIPWIESLDFLPGRALIALYCLMASASIIWIWKQKIWKPLPLVFLVLILGRVAFGLTVLPGRKLATDSVTTQRIVDALAVTDLVQDKELYVYGDSHFSLGVAFYMTRALGKIVPRKDGIRPEAFYIVEEKYLPRFRGKPTYEIEYEGLCSYLLWEGDVE